MVSAKNVLVFSRIWFINGKCAPLTVHFSLENEISHTESDQVITVAYWWNLSPFLALNIDYDSTKDTSLTLVTISHIKFGWKHNLRLLARYFYPLNSFSWCNCKSTSELMALILGIRNIWNVISPGISDYNFFLTMHIRETV